ncbi:MAG TPA: NADP-dependent phosphogluconate dehydrogenase [Candidatus Peribacterales bacterium]|nr:NADP-dependent phosphogluconate dehydrogenase [Candidatus Peribacterales bacterium]
MQLGVIGLGTMGANLARNAARNGAEVFVFNRTQERTDEFMAAHKSEGAIKSCDSLDALVSSLHTPRPILLMVKAGDAVDEMIVSLTPLLQKGDIIIDAGNSHSKDTERRFRDCEAKGIHFLGMGVSGGEEGALHGPSMMPGGEKEAWKIVESLFTKMAAEDGMGGKCITYIGAGGSGHFVKMIHNGIEYADMQLIAEAYHLLSYLHPGLTNAELAETFAEWNTAEKSYLLEITTKIFRKKDTETNEYLIDVIQDAAKQKGTGKWVIEAALDLGVPVPTIAASVDARVLSSMKEERGEAWEAMHGVPVETPSIERGDVQAALYLSRLCAYAQGMALLKHASDEYQWNLNLAEINRIWQGGCIIRSALLREISNAFATDPQLKNLILSPSLMEKFREKFAVWNGVLSKGILAGLPLPAMSASLSYFTSYSWDRLPQNLTQAQRDFFGAHGYERTDREGTFHTEWNT